MTAAEVREFSEKWIKKSPRAKTLKMVDCYDNGIADDGSTDVTICFNRKVDG